MYNILQYIAIHNVSIFMISRIVLYCSIILCIKFNLLDNTFSVVFKTAVSLDYSCAISVNFVDGKFMYVF